MQKQLDINENQEFQEIELDSWSADAIDSLFKSTGLLLIGKTAYKD